MFEMKVSIGWFVLFALLLHWWASTIPVSLRTISMKDKAQNLVDDAIVVEPFDDSKQVVQTSRAEKQEEKELEKDARFFGELRNRVKKELRSPFAGRFKEGTRVQGGGKANGDGPKLSDLLAYSSSPDHLPDDVESGSETMLNTDPVLYASFINRVADEIYDSWVHFATDAVDTVYVLGRKLSPQTYITKISVALDKEGNVNSIRTVKSSGVYELDEAPKKAFWDAEPFPNPPSQMFRSKEIARFIYEFHFEWKKSTFNIIPLI